MTTGTGEFKVNMYVHVLPTLGEWGLTIVKHLSSCFSKTGADGELLSAWP